MATVCIESHLLEISHSKTNDQFLNFDHRGETWYDASIKSIHLKAIRAPC